MQLISWFYIKKKKIISYLLVAPYDNFHTNICHNVNDITENEWPAGSNVVV